MSPTASVRLLLCAAGLAALACLVVGLTRTVVFERTPGQVADERTGRLLVLLACLVLLVLAAVVWRSVDVWVPVAPATPAVACGGLTLIAGGPCCPSSSHCQPAASRWLVSARCCSAEGGESLGTGRSSRQARQPVIAAEADGNRTRQDRMPALTGVEDRGAHQERVRLLGPVTRGDSRSQRDQEAACHTTHASRTPRKIIPTGRHRCLAPIAAPDGTGPRPPPRPLRLAPSPPLRVAGLTLPEVLVELGVDCCSFDLPAGAYADDHVVLSARTFPYG